MLDGAAAPVPPRLTRIEAAAAAAELYYGSDPRVGALLRTLAAAKPGGRFLELGTGIGVGAAWILDGMDGAARLITVDEQDAAGIARRCLGDDPRVELVTADAGSFLAGLGGRTFDLIFADAPPGKLTDRERALDALAPGGFYVVDDMLPDPGREDRGPVLAALQAALLARRDLVVTGLPWATGVILASRRA
jgi:predicted O-methyltransferase YrrM